MLKVLTSYRFDMTHSISHSRGFQRIDWILKIWSTFGNSSLSGILAIFRRTSVENLHLIKWKVATQNSWVLVFDYFHSRTRPTPSDFANPSYIVNMWRLESYRFCLSNPIFLFLQLGSKQLIAFRMSKTDGTPKSAVDSTYIFWDIYKTVQTIGSQFLEFCGPVCKIRAAHSLKKKAYNSYQIKLCNVIHHRLWENGEKIFWPLIIYTEQEDDDGATAVTQA